MAGLMEQLEQELADMLLADPYFADVDVHVDPQKNIVAEITKKLSSLRLLAAPLVSGAECRNPDEPGPVFGGIKMAVGVFENPIAHLSSSWNGKTARQTCEKIHGILHLATPMTLTKCIYSAPVAIEQTPNESLNIYTCHFLGEGQLTYQLPTAATPTGQTNAGQVTLGCATAGAAIFYTLDGTYPGPRGGTLYAGAFAAPAPGTKLKARAWLAGYMASTVLQMIF